MILSFQLVTRNLPLVTRVLPHTFQGATFGQTSTDVMIHTTILQPLLLKIENFYIYQLPEGLRISKM